MTIGKYWNEKIETMPIAELRKHQLKKLKEQVKHCYDHSAFYKHDYWQILERKNRNHAYS